ncbi:MAG: MerR family transcriptional regulator [Eubacteriales bacterium]|nr:MerR family transcriptional regulator [Eubacteriales bacterium]
MTLTEAEKAFGISMDTLKKYISSGFIRQSDTNCGASEYRNEDFDRLGLVSILLEAGFSTKEIRRYLELSEHAGTDEEQIRMLRKQRGCLLDDIHKKQKTLDRLDFMVWNTQNRGAKK